MLSIWQDSSRRAKGVFLGCIGIAALLLTFAPVWDTTADAAITGADFSPKTGSTSSQITFTGLSECVDTPNVFDVVLEVDTQANGDVDAAARPFQANGVYAMLAPPEHDFLAGNATAGPTYDVKVLCATDEGGTLVVSELTFDDGFTYQRATTTSTTAASTSSTAATTSTTAATTSSTAATTSTTAATTSSTSATTSTTGGSTSSTAGASTSSTTGGTSSTTSTLPQCTTVTTNPGDTTTSTAPCTTSTTGTTQPPLPTCSSTTLAGTSTTACAPVVTSPSTTSTTAPASTTTSTVVGDTTSTTVGATTTTAAPACTVGDTTPTIGQSVSVACGGYAPGTPVTVDLLSDPVRLATLTANANGQVVGSVSIPLTAAAGAHEVRFTGTAPGGSALVRSVAVTVSRELPRTGDDTWTLLRYGMLLFGIGLLATGRSQLLTAR